MHKMVDRRLARDCPKARGLLLGVQGRASFRSRMAVLLAGACTLSAGAGDRETAAASAGLSASIRPVRVLIAADAERLRIRIGNATVRACPDGPPGIDPSPEEWLVVSCEPPGEIRIGSKKITGGCIELTSDPPHAVSISLPYRTDWGPVYEYSGRLAIHCNRDGRLEVVNEIDLETYVASVTASESAPDFLTEALRGQAIISRTFVLFLMGRRAGQAYDVSATQASQVYQGQRSDEFGERARSAAEYTRGVVCTFEKNGREELFPTYYSSVCGGMSQSAAIFDGHDTAEPLRGGVRCEYCRIGPPGSYRWGPVSMPAQEVLARLAHRYPAAWNLGRLSAIDVLERSESGRATRLRLSGTSGESLELPAENFRLAIGATIIKSTDCRVRIVGDDVVWSEGKGFGHGLGLCQWGMQGQALQGKKAGEILKFYYPGCRLNKAY